VTSVEQAGQCRRCAVIYNPTKVSDKFHALVDDSLQRGGWGTRCGWRPLRRIQAAP
jgi:hypothetical protein